MRILRFVLVISVLTIGVMLSVYRCTSPEIAQKDTFFLNLSDTVNYVGIQKCRVCHEDHYNTFINTGMGKSFGVASRSRSKTKPQTKPVYDAKKDMYYFAAWVGDQLQITEFRLNGKDTVHKRSEKVSHIIGSGQHTNSHFWMDGGFLYQAPLTYYTQSGQWDLPPGYESVNTGFTRKIDIECMSCHNAIPEIENGSMNKFIKIPEGIDCERCHGPGELHVNLKSRGILVDTKKTADRSIVNPARLPWKLQVDICQRCHLQGNNVLKPGKSFTDFRPGMKLSDVFDVFMPGNQNGTFVMAGHAERLQMSQCFIQSNKNDVDIYNPKLNFTCITCHNPHVSVRETNIDKFNTACKNCHAENGISKLHNCSEKQELIQKQYNNCVACHMPANKTRDIPHVRVHDHFIRKNYGKQPAPKKDLLYVVNEKNTDSETEINGYITWFEKFDPQALYLDQAEQLIAKREPGYQTLIHFWYANSAWDKIVQYATKVPKDEKDAWTNYRIAKAFDRSGKLNDALEWYARAVDAMQLNSDFQVEFSNALVRAKRYPEAQKLLKTLLEVQPKNVLALVNAGAAFSEENQALAIRYLKKAIALDPDIENAHLYLGEIYLRNGNKKEASHSLLEALRINKGNETAQKMLAEIAN